MEEKNFLGRGQTVKISIGRGTQTNTYNFSFSDPYFLGRRMLFGIDAYKRTQTAGAFRPYSTDTLGGQIRLGLPITENFNVQANYKIMQRTVAYGTSGCPAPQIPPPGPGLGTGNFDCNFYFPAGTTLTSSLGYQLLYSTIDNYQDPRSGAFVRFSQDFAGVGGNNRFIQSTVDARYYMPLTSKADIVGVARVQGGNITGLGQNVAVIDNFFKGGETIRGFCVAGYRRPLARLPAARWAARISLPQRRRCSSRSRSFRPDFGLRAAVFADAGSLWGIDPPAGLPLTDIQDGFVLRSSAGASILWASPFGLLRADFAVPLTKATWDKTEWFRFGLGNQF